MDDHNHFMHFSWSPKGNEETNFIETDEIDELNDMIEEQVEGYEEVNMLEENSDNNDNAYDYIDDNMMPEKYDTQENIYNHLNDDILSNSARIGVGTSHLIEQRVKEAESKIIGDQDAQEEFTAEVITEEDWIQSQGEEIVPIAMEQIITSGDYQEEDIIDAVPLQTDQDEYTTQRPYPCDFCSRRFRKKANLINHMVAHQNVRPHMCNLCGSRYVRKCDLDNHLRIHAYTMGGEDVASPSTSGGKKKSLNKFDNLLLDSTYDDDLPDEHEDDDEFNEDYNHFSKIQSTSGKVKPPSTSNLVSKPSSSNSGLGAGKKKPTSAVIKKQPQSKPAIKFEKLSKDKSLSSEYNITIKKDNNIASKIDEYVERFPITDPRKPFVCQICSVAFTREKALESHMKLHASQEPTHDCEVCGDSFFDNNSLEEHLELRHNYSARFKKTGGKTTSGKVPSRAQMIDYDDSNSSEYDPDKHHDEIDEDDDDYDEDNHHVCDKCDLTFKTPESFKRHIKTHFIKSEMMSDDEVESGNGKKSVDGTNHGCNVCGESFTEPLDLLAHAEIHARFQPFKCLLCGETFFEENKIKMHLMELHREEMTESSCKLCGKQCRDQRSLIKHSWEHSRDRAHSCSKCGKTFHNKARLKRHISSHRNKSVVCEICHEEFSDGRELMNHRHSHTKANQFPCNECGKTFGSRSSQQIHIRIHTGERPYQCRFCWKAFADGGTLRKHERIHTGEKPYCCLICNRAFNQRVVLREHIRSHHSAPDPQNGTTLTPYYCSLCGELFAVSLELTHHLIEHSDRSTAAKRVQPTGPRKYKRRRRLSDAEIPSTSSSAILESTKNSSRSKLNTTKIKQEPTDSPSSSPIKKTYGLLTMSLATCNMSKNFVEFNLPDDIFETVSRERKLDMKKTFNSQLSQKPSLSSSRPKMIYTEKTRVPVYDGKRKTRTMIQKQILGGNRKKLLTPKKEKITPSSVVKHVPAKYKFGEDEERMVDNDVTDGSETCSNEDDPNEDVLKVLLKRERKLSEKFTVDLVNDLQEILRSPLKLTEKIIQDEEEGDEELLDNNSQTTLKVRRSVRQTPSLYGTGNRRSFSINQQQQHDEIVTIKQEVFDCEICGDTFENREKLLSHVPIHI